MKPRMYRGKKTLWLIYRPI